MLYPRLSRCMFAVALSAGLPSTMGANDSVLEEVIVTTLGIEHSLQDAPTVRSSRRLTTTTRSRVIDPHASQSSPMRDFFDATDIFPLCVG